jgi:hypothetical protein
MTDFEENQATPEAEEPTGLSAEKTPEEETPPETVSEAQPSSAPAESESRSRSLFRSAIRWTLSLLVAFSIGALVVFLLLYLPIRQELDQVSLELQEAQVQIIQMSGQIDELSAENQELDDELTTLKIQATLFNVLVDVRAASLALAVDDYAGARLSLLQAYQGVGVLEDLLGLEQRDVLNAIQDNLSEMLEVIQDDLQSAGPGLERLAYNLTQLLETLFPE